MTATKTKPRRKAKTVTPAAQAKADARAEAREARETNLKDLLEGWLAEATQEDIEEALGKFSKDHGTGPANRFSPRNACLIVAQDEDATDVRSPLDWLDAGRKVRPRPEHGEGDAITIVGFRGDGKTKEQREQAEAAQAAKQPGEISSDDLKPRRNFYDLRLVYDIRHTEALVCRDCRQPIHRTGFAPDSRRFHAYTHTGVKTQPDHKALPPRREDAGTEEAV